MVIDPIERLSKRNIIRAIIIDLVDPRLDSYSAEEYLKEIVFLTEASSRIKVVDCFQQRGTANKKTFIGKGKLETIKEQIKNLDIDLIIVNAKLKSYQMIALQKTFHAHVWDKVDLILDIFEQRAFTDEAKLQIELAKLKYQIPRIYTYHATTLFERAGAGIGTRGAGERGIEEEKRHLRRRIKAIEKKIKKVKLNRETQRRRRKRRNMPVVAIVGYTNAGKSTFLKAMTNKKVYVADKLFATLDTRIGRVWSQNLQGYILFTDTIGFIRDLPPLLVESFQATLEETLSADMIIHLFDGSHPQWKEKVDVTEKILQDIGVEAIPQILVSNKSDIGCPLTDQKIFRISSLSKKSFKELFEYIEKEMKSKKI